MTLLVCGCLTGDRSMTFIRCDSAVRHEETSLLLWGSSLIQKHLLVFLVFCFQQLKAWHDNCWLLKHFQELDTYMYLWILKCVTLPCVIRLCFRLALPSLVTTISVPSVCFGINFPPTYWKTSDRRETLTAVLFMAGHRPLVLLKATNISLCRFDGSHYLTGTIYFEDLTN